MRLSVICERRITIDNETMPPTKISILENPPPLAVINMLQKLPRAVGTSLGGWISDNGIFVWDRDDASHHHIANVFKINARKAMAFYIRPIRRDSKGQITDIGFEVSDFSSRATIDQLLDHPYIMDLMNVVAKRKEQDENIEQDDYQELLGSLRGSDY